MSSSRSSGVGFTSLLTILFIGLKLGGVITWPWIWILAPFWISSLFVILVLFLILAIAIFAAIKGN